VILTSSVCFSKLQILFRISARACSSLLKNLSSYSLIFKSFTAQTHLLRSAKFSHLFVTGSSFDDGVWCNGQRVGK